VAQKCHSRFSYYGVHISKKLITRQRISKKEEGKSHMSGAALLFPSKILGEGIKEIETLKYIQFKEVQCSSPNRT
jgi:hypothetical protein